jgi:glycosyltransferase involved in cell wall biosynthesis
MDISFNVLVHNEGETIEKLLNQIITVATPLYGFEIIIIDDFSTDERTKEILDTYRTLDNVHIFQRALNKDFASQKNFANSKCTGKYIVNIDADEYFQEDLLDNVYNVMEGNSEVDMIWVPRINIVNGLRQEHVTKWGWNVNDKGWVNFPDYQARLYRNATHIKWKNKVHEVIDGAKAIGRLPPEEEWCILHIKDIDKQEKQNNFYDTINGDDEYVPISLEYFLGMELAQGGGGKEIITQDDRPEGRLKNIEEVVKFWTGEMGVGNMLTPQVWQYYNVMRAGFRKNVADHHELGWENMSMEYYSALDEMSDAEIEIFLRENPVEFENGIVKHSYHRACAMIGRLTLGKKYLPFYMKRENVYDVPFKDGRIRIENPILHVNKLKELDVLGIPRSDYTICQSGILALMGIRSNDDLDIIISDRLRTALNKGSEGFSIGPGIDVFPQNYDKFKQFGCVTDNSAISNYSKILCGYQFLEPRFYFSRKHKDKIQRDLDDWNAIREFFEMESHRGYPFNAFNDEQWYNNASIL